MSGENVFVPEESAPNQINFATVAAVYDDGLSLFFDGETEASEKHYQCNSFIVFKVKDRVRIIEDSGTYVVEYPVGNPKKSFTADRALEASHAASADQATNATNAANAQNASNANSASTASRATNADNADKLGNKSAANLQVYSASYMTERHTGSYLSFFNNAVTSRKTVSAISSPSAATASSVASKVNELISALKAYSLIWG